MDMQIPGFQIERQIGRGGMATVYLARQKTFNRQVALKIIAPALASDPDFTRRFLREGELAAQLYHPNIIKVFDTGVSDNIYYLAMEYFPFGMLYQRIQQGLPLVSALAIIRQIADALNYAHKQGIIHRDIKSQNILLYENDTPVISDFGIAKAATASTVLTSSGAVVGSPNYMSPEQIRGKPVDPRADIYSLGILFYEMLVGRVPYTADDFMALAYKQVHEPVPVLPARLADFQPVVEKMLAKDPEQRFQSGEQCIEALMQAEAESETLHVITGTTRVSAVQTKKTFASVRVRSLVISGALMSVVLAAGGFYYGQAQNEQLEQQSLAEQVRQQQIMENDQQRITQALNNAKQYQRADDFQAALDEIRKGLNAAPQAPELLALQQTLTGQLAQQQRQRQEIARRLSQAQRHQANGDLAASLEEITRGLEIAPQSAELLALRTGVYQQLTGSPAQAEIKPQDLAVLEQQRQQEIQQKTQELEQLLTQTEAPRAVADVTAGLATTEGGSGATGTRSIATAAASDSTTASLPSGFVSTSPEVVLLLAKAQRAFRENKLLTPAENNTVKWAEAILLIDPDNSRAKTLLSQVIDKYLVWAASKTTADQATQAMSYLEKAKSLQQHATASQRGVIQALDDDIKAINSRVRSKKSTKSSTRSRTRTEPQPYIPYTPPRTPQPSGKRWYERFDDKMKRFGCKLDRKFGQECSR